MATDNVMSCQILALTDGNYYSIRKYIECVFDDGDLSQAESGSESSNAAESCFGRATSEFRDVDILNAKDCNSNNNDQNVAFNDVILADKNVDDSSLSKVAQPPDNDMLTLASKNEKVKFSLKTPRSVILKQTQMCLEEPDTSTVQLFMPGRTSSTFTTVSSSENLGQENMIDEVSKCKSISPRIEDNLERSCIQSSGRRGTSTSSSSSSNSSSKARHSSSKEKSRSNLHRRKHSSSKIFKEKFRNIPYDREQTYSSKSGSRKSSNKRDSKRGTPKHSRTKSKRSKGLSSESERIIAAQFLPPFLCKDSNTESSENRVKVSKLNEEVSMNEMTTVCKKGYEERTRTCEKDSYKSQSNLNYFEKKNKTIASEINSSTILSPPATFDGDAEDSGNLVHKGLLPLSPNSDRLSQTNVRNDVEKHVGTDQIFDLWDIDPLLINSIQTDEDILITQDKVKELKMSLKCKASDSKHSDEKANKVVSFEEEIEEFQVLEPPGVGYVRTNPKCTCDTTLLKSAIGSLETFEDVSVCFSLLLKRLQRLTVKSRTNLRMNKFINKLKELLKIELDFDETDSESSLSNFDRGIIPSHKSIQIIETEENSVVHKSNILNKGAFTTKSRKRVSIVSPVSSGTESDGKPDDLQVIEQQLKAVLNPAILRNEISKDEYGEIVRMVVTKVGQCRKRLYKFDCISFLHKTLQAVKRRKLS